MNIDVNVLQALPEIAPARGGLRPKTCKGTKVMCWDKVSCHYTIISVIDE